MEMITILKIGGGYNILCALLHVAFPGMFKWGEILKLLPEEKEPFLSQPLYIMNWCLMIFWLILAYIPVFHGDELLKPGIGRTLLFSIVLFWIIRLFILQPLYIGMKEPVSWVMSVFWLIGLILFAVPLIQSVF